MIRTVSRYVLGRTIVALFATMAIALAALMLERLLRLLDLTVNSDQSIFLVFGMLINLVPHYMGIALPVAFFLAVWFAFNRLSNDSELTALIAGGVGLHKLLRPIMWFALVITIITVFILGYLQPYGRYAYRSLVHAVQHASLSAILDSGAFVQVGNMTFMAEAVSGQGHNLSKVFVHVEAKDGKSITTTSPAGALQDGEADLRPVLHLAEGNLLAVKSQGDGGEVVTFNNYEWPVGEAGIASFRERGKDVKEMTLPELWFGDSLTPEPVSSVRIRAEFHDRLVRTLSTFFLPILAIPLGLGIGRTRRSSGIIFGLLILVFYQKVIQFGSSLALLGHVSPWLGLWLPLALFATGSSYLFFRVSFTVASDPVGTFVEGLQDMAHRIPAFRGAKQH